MWSYVAWGLWAAIFLVLEGLGLLHKRGSIPWTTLSTFTRGLEKSHSIIRVLILAGLSVLTWHIVSPAGFP